MSQKHGPNAKLGSNSAARAATGGRSRRKEYADLPEWARPDKGHKPPSEKANREIAEHRKAAKGGAANQSLQPSPQSATQQPATPAASKPAKGAAPSGGGRARGPKLNYNPAAVTGSIGGSAQVVLVLMVILGIMVEWNFVKSVFGVIWGGGSDKMTTSSLKWNQPLGVILFIAIVVFLASISSDMGGLMLLLAMGLFAVYMIENNGGLVSSLFNWLNPNVATDSTGSSKTGSSSTGSASGGSTNKKG